MLRIHSTKNVKKNELGISCLEPPMSRLKVSFLMIQTLSCQLGPRLPDRHPIGSIKKYKLLFFGDYFLLFLSSANKVPLSNSISRRIKSFISTEVYSKINESRIVEKNRVEILQFCASSRVLSSCTHNNNNIRLYVVYEKFRMDNIQKIQYTGNSRYTVYYTGIRKKTVYGISV